jgi:hypothetical protein
MKRSEMIEVGDVFVRKNGDRYVLERVELDYCYAPTREMIAHVRGPNGPAVLLVRDHYPYVDVDSEFSMDISHRTPEIGDTVVSKETGGRFLIIGYKKSINGLDLCHLESADGSRITASAEFIPGDYWGLIKCETATSSPEIGDTVIFLPSCTRYKIVERNYSVANPCFVLEGRDGSGPYYVSTNHVPGINWALEKRLATRSDSGCTSARVCPRCGNNELQSVRSQMLFGEAVEVRKCQKCGWC